MTASDLLWDKAKERAVLQAGGRIPARICSWCGAGKTEADKIASDMGAPKAHWLCPDCLRDRFPEIPANQEDGWRSPEGEKVSVLSSPVDDAPVETSKRVRRKA